MSGSRAWTALAALVLVLAMFAGQAGTLAAGTGGLRADSGRIAATTGAAYLTGLRKFGAAVLWNRIDPLIHDYYRNQGLDQMKFMVPSLVAVTWLDPHLVSATYILPWMLAKNGRTADALALAAQGVADNPSSGLLRIGYAQILDLYGKDPQKAADQVEAALEPGTQWLDDLEKWDNLRLGVDILKAAGRDAEAAKLMVLLDQISAANGGPTGLQNLNTDVEQPPSAPAGTP